MYQEKKKKTKRREKEKEEKKGEKEKKKKGEKEKKKERKKEREDWKKSHKISTSDSDRCLLKTIYMIYWFHASPQQPMCLSIDDTLTPPPPPPPSLQYTKVPTENRAVLLNRALFSCIAALVSHQRMGGSAASADNTQHVTIFTQNTTFFCQPVLKITQNSIMWRCFLHKLRFTSDSLF